MHKQFPQRPDVTCVSFAATRRILRTANADTVRAISDTVRAPCVTVIAALMLSVSSIYSGSAFGFISLDDDDLLDMLPAILQGAQSYSSVGGGGSTPQIPTIGGPEDVSGGTLKVERQGNRLLVTSSKPPTWKAEFAIGGGAPGGGTAISLYIPSTSSRSIVENTPGRACCSGLGLDNLEWRWRPFGQFNGTRGALGLSSNVTSFKVQINNPTTYQFQIKGSWSGVRAFTRTTKITPNGYTTSLDATYSGASGNDSMWWIISLFNTDKLNNGSVTIQDSNTAPRRLYHTGGGTGLPSGIGLPYTVNFPLKGSSNNIHMTVSQLGQNQGGNPNLYEFFNKGAPVGNYYLFYPRWVGVFKGVTYNFNWAWRFVPK